MPTLSQKLRDEYRRLFASCQINASRRTLVDRAAQSVLGNQSRYRAVGDPLGIPWTVIAAIHNLESSQSFKRHLHNGDPLSARTVQVPAGRPRDGMPPFTWEVSAQDALRYRKLEQVSDWSLPAALFRIEAYNGWGYRTHHPEVLSPYLWSFTQHYGSGKYVADGKWSKTAVSEQCGAAALLRRLAELGQLGLPPEDDAPMLPEAARYATSRPRDRAELARAIALQEWLNTLPGVFLRVDGVCGEKTSNAWQAVSGAYLPGDPRGR